MTDFSQLQRLQPTRERTSDYMISQIEGAPVLTIRFAGEANKPYWRALLKCQAARPRSSMRRSPEAMDRALKSARDDDRALYAAHVIVGWRDIKDASGAAVPFSAEACVAFLAALPDYLFDEVRVHATEQSNFQEMMDGEELAKI
jgi:hypothetical protein